MYETTKTKKIWTEHHRSFLKGKGIDIGCGPDPVFKDVVRFDVEQGDANEITKYVNDEFDFVFSSHCLEHMKNPYIAILEWWKLVKPGGHLFVIVPDEDLYEQGHFPSRFNADHKSTYTIKNEKSWSPVSVNVNELIKTLPNSILIDLQLHDHNYKRDLMKRGVYLEKTDLFSRIQKGFYTFVLKYFSNMDKFLSDRKKFIYDQTTFPNTLAQIQFIIKKMN
jgi:SAM-dependent methyltransferase